MGARRKRPAFKPYAVGEYRLGWLLDQFCVVWYVNGQRRRHRLGIATEAEARTELHAFARSHLKLTGEPVETFKALHAQYTAYCKQEGKDAERPRHVYARIGETFGHLRPVDITRKICREYEAMRAAAGKKPHTIYGELNMVRTVVNWAAKNKLIKLEELPSIYVPKMPGPRDRHLTRAEVETLIDAAEMPHIRLFLILALTTAARKTAILQLTWDRVDFARGLIQLHDPGHDGERKGRALVPMNDTARAALLEAKAGGVSEFVIEWAGGPVGNVKRGVSTAFVKSRLKVKGDGAHVLRHTAAVLMAEDGVPIPEIAQYLGHSDLRTTYRTYARFSPGYLKKAAGSLELPVHLRVSDRGSR
ncbi:MULTISPECIES: site-specific integrase [Rhodomicrobium]|uniref:tyrosine-type recombinase/integrase n=1 Tax=Rhodomicrobium TaxID=1068 RepID=UPI000B4BE75A|nr:MULTISPECIES: site-specific integrase [Rhodomicrobium]